MSAEIAALRNEVAELKRLLISISDTLERRPAMTTTETTFSPQILDPLPSRDMTPEEISREMSRGNFAPLHEQNKRREAARKKAEHRKKIKLRNN